MSLVFSLEKQSQLLNDQINDLLQVIELNLSALGVQCEEMLDSKKNVITHCQNEFNKIKQLFQQRAKLRLQYLITQQIKQEQAKVRKDRLKEYEDKIVDQHRLICQKQAAYQYLMNMKFLRKPNMTSADYNMMMKKETQKIQRYNFQRMEGEIKELRTIDEQISKENKQLQRIINKFEQFPSNEQLQTLEWIIEHNKNSQYNLEYNFEDCKVLQMIVKEINQIKTGSQTAYKQYSEEKQMYDYLRWENRQLKIKYKQICSPHVGSKLKPSFKSDLKLKRALSL